MEFGHRCPISKLLSTDLFRDRACSAPRDITIPCFSAPVRLTVAELSFDKSMCSVHDVFKMRVLQRPHHICSDAFRRVHLDEEASFSIGNDFGDCSNCSRQDGGSQAMASNIKVGSPCVTEGITTNFNSLKGFPILL